VKDEYFEIVQQFKLWLSEKLGDYGNNESCEEKLNDGNYILTEREKEGLALARAMLNRITKHTLLAGG
jgi:hypothetical protein